MDDYEFRRQENLVHQRQALALLRTDGWHDDLCLMMQQGLSAQCSLMSDLLHMTSTAYDREQLFNMHTMGQRSWKILEFHEQKHTFAYFQQLAIELDNPPLCRQEPQTEDAFSKIFRLWCRAPAVVYQLVFVPSSGFPYKLFKLLASRDVATCEAMLTTPKCMLDPGSQKFISRFDTLDKLMYDSDVLQCLGALAMTMQGTTYSTERIHSSNARRRRGVVHTNVPSLDKLAWQHAAFAGFEWLRAHPGTHIQQVGNKQEAVPAPAAPGKRAFRTRKPKRKRGGGGAWRAYCHHQISELKVPNDFKVLADRYKQLSEDELLFYKELGRQG